MTDNYSAALLIAAYWLAACQADWSLGAELPPRSTPAADAGAVDRASCESVPALATTPLIDGQLEPGLALWPWTDALAGVPEGASASVVVAHHTNGLYFFADVHDQSSDPAPVGTFSYCGDAVELYVDDDGIIQMPPAYDDPGTMQFVIARPSANAAAGRRAQRFRGTVLLGDWTADGFIAVTTATGYAVEAFVTASDLGLVSWSPSSGGSVGWSFSWDLGGAPEPPPESCATRLAQYHLRTVDSAECPEPYCNAAALCRAVLAP